MKKNLILASAASLVIAAPAFAQSETLSWTGPYVGGQIGYGWQSGGSGSSIEFDTDRDGAFGDTVRTLAGANAFSPGFCGGAAITALPAAGCKPDKDGVDWKIHAGYDMQFGQFVAGIVGEYGRSTISDSVSAYSTTPARYTMTRKLKDNAGLRARVGYSLGNTLMFATGGGAWGKIRNSFTTSNAANSFSGNGNDSVWGYKYGGGVEQRVSQNFSIGAQYMHTRFNDDSYRVTAGPGVAPPTNPFLLVNAAGTDFRRSDNQFGSHAVNVTASYRF